MNPSLDRQLGDFYNAFLPYASRYLSRRLRISARSDLIRDHIHDYFMLKVMCGRHIAALKSELEAEDVDASVIDSLCEQIKERSVKFHLQEWEENPRTCVEKNTLWCYRMTISALGTAGKDPVERRMRSARTPKEVSEGGNDFDHELDPIPEIETIQGNGAKHVSTGEIEFKEIENLIEGVFASSVGRGKRARKKMLEVFHLRMRGYRNHEIADLWLRRGWAKNQGSARAQVSLTLAELKEMWRSYSAGEH